LRPWRHRRELPGGSHGLNEHPLGATFAGLLLFVIGVGIAVTAYEIDRRERDARRGTIAADGQVITVLHRQTEDGDAYAPLIAFSTRTGERVSFTGPATADPSVYWIGQTLRIMYPPWDPAHAMLDRRGRRYARNALAFGAAFVLVLLGGYVAWYARTRVAHVDVSVRRRP
jgi:hypothetical protein